MPNEVDRPKVREFIALTFGISWISALLIYVSGVEYGTVTSIVLITVFYMWSPAVSAVIVQLRRRESVRDTCGLRTGRLRWVVFAWLAPLFVLAFTIAIGLSFPDVSFSTDYALFLSDLGLSEAQVEENIALLEGLPVPPVLFFIVQGLLAGATINAVAALGEELGWRGLLLSELSPLGFWGVSAVTGFVWGVWHAPIVAQGHNFPEVPLLGIVVMTVWTVTASPVFTYLTVRARSVLAATFFHGTFNAIAGFSLIYLVGAGNLLLLPVGVAGIGAAVFATTLCVVHDRYVADERITTGTPLSPWEDTSD